MLSLVNKSSYPDIDLTLVANAMNQSAHDWAGQWYGHPPIVSPHPGHQWTMQLVDEDKNVPGALAYHEDPNAIPDAVVMVKTFEKYTGKHGADLYYGPGGVLTGATHEWLEMLGDLWCNGWSVNWDTGQAVANENSDPVESSDYPVTATDRLGHRQPAHVTNFVLPAWFNNGSKGPFDFLHHLSYPFEIDHGGYCVVADLSNESQIAADKGHGQLVRIAGKVPTTGGYRSMRRFGLTYMEEIALQELAP